MFTNGSTAIECGGGLKAAGGAPEDDVALDVARTATGFEIHGLLMSRYASAARTSSATATNRARLNGAGLPVVRGIGNAPETGPAGNLAVIGGPGDSSLLMRATNSGGVSPLVKRVH